MKLDDLRTRYKLNSTNEKTVESMMFIINSIEKNFSEYDDAWTTSLDLL